MQQNPLFSVLVAHYKNEVFFEDFYQSIIQQKYSNWEVIILDDGSEKESFARVKEIVGDDSRFLIFKNRINSGVGFTKKKLIELSNGEIVGFVDPDDTIDPNAIETAIDAYRNNSEIVLTYSKMMFCDEKLKPLYPYKSAKQVPNGDKSFFNLANQISHFVTFKKSVYETTDMMNSELKIAEDQDLYLKMYEKGRVKFINKINYNYRLHGNGISQNQHKEKSYDYFAQVIYSAMKRRGLRKINGQKIPDSYPGKEKIYALLDFQNSIPYRIKKKLKVLFYG